MTAEERRTLDAVAARTGKSISALIREAVTEVYGVERSLDDDLAAMEKGYGAWGSGDETGAEYVESIRSGGTRWAELYPDQLPATDPAP